MRIGIDIDDTLTNSSQTFYKYAKKYNRKNKIKFKIKKNEFNQEKAYGWNEFDKTNFKNEYLKQILSNTSLKRNSKKIINKLNKKHEIIFITARNDNEIDNMYNFTFNWLRKKEISFNKLIVNSNNKLQDCINEKIDIFIDDNINTCNRLNDSKIKVLLYDSVFNKKDNNLMRVKTWNQIYKIIEKGEK